MFERSWRIVVHLCSVEMLLSNSIDNGWSFAVTYLYVRGRYSYARSHSSSAYAVVILGLIFRMLPFHVTLSPLCDDVEWYATESQNEVKILEIFQDRLIIVAGFVSMPSPSMRYAAYWRIASPAARCVCCVAYGLPRTKMWGPLVFAPSPAMRCMVYEYPRPPPPARPPIHLRVSLVDADTWF
jgi:hypothetical protein